MYKRPHPLEPEGLAGEEAAAGAGACVAGVVVAGDRFLFLILAVYCFQCIVIRVAALC